VGRCRNDCRDGSDEAEAASSSKPTGRVATVWRSSRPARRITSATTLLIDRSDSRVPVRDSHNGPPRTSGRLGWFAAIGVPLAQRRARRPTGTARHAGRLATEAPALELAEFTGALESLVALPDEHAR